MPHRLQSMHEGLTVMLASMWAMCAAIADLTGIPPNGLFNGPAIYDDERQRLLCIIGAIGGALVNLGLYKSSEPGIAPMARKVTCSALTGVVSTPLMIHWVGATPNSDNLLAVSFFMAIVSVGTLKMGVSAWQKWVSSRLGLNGQADQCAVPPAPAPINPPPPSIPPNPAAPNPPESNP